jgi:hypothetical protein
VGHLYFLGALLQTPHALSAMFLGVGAARGLERHNEQDGLREDGASEKYSAESVKCRQGRGSSAGGPISVREGRL